MGCVGSSHIVEPVEDSEFHRRFLLTQKLGKGNFGSVYAARRVQCDDVQGDEALVDACPEGADALAVKVVDLSAREDGVVLRGTVSEQLRRLLTNEVKAMRLLEGHPNIVRLWCARQEMHLAYLVMERCEHSLVDGLARLHEASEPSFGAVFRQMLQGIAAVHSTGLVHRDVKPDNFLVASDVVKLCDFGFAGVLGGCRRSRAPIGTPLYMAPEMVCEEVYDAKVDVWSFGVIVYVLLFGRFPYGASPFEAMCRVRRCDVQIDFQPGPAPLSPEAAGFARALLQRTARARPSAEEALAHAFLAPSAGSGAAGRADDALRPALEAAQAALRATAPEERASQLEGVIMGLQRRSQQQAKARPQPHQPQREGPQAKLPKAKSSLSTASTCSGGGSVSGESSG